MSFAYRGIGFVVLIAIMSAWSALDGTAAVVSGGDLVTAGGGGVGTGYHCWAVVHPNGTQEVLLQGSFPADVEIAPNGDLYLLESWGYESGGALYRWLGNGATEVVCSGEPFSSPAALAIGPDGALFVADQYAFGQQGAIFEINPSTGARREILRGGQPNSVVAIDNATLAISAYEGLALGIKFIDRFTGSVTRSFYLQEGLSELAFGQDGILWAVSNNRLYRISLGTTITATYYTAPAVTIYDVAVDANGTLLVAVDDRTGRLLQCAILHFNPASSEFEPYLPGSFVLAQISGMARAPFGPTPTEPMSWGRIKATYRK
jgi:streptogramin lyase